MRTVIKAPNLLSLLTLAILLQFAPIVLWAQKQNKHVSAYVKRNYKASNNRYLKACKDLERKRQDPRKPVAISRKAAAYKPTKLSGAELADNSIPPPRKLNKIPDNGSSEVASRNVDTKDLHVVTENVDSAQLVKLHKKEDEVLSSNHLTKPTSKKHEEIRKKVEQELKENKDNLPISLEPLYFTFNEDEFSVVDMDPFLVAVEYALQGRFVLIEGHTDSRGDQKYNVDLSLKRVQKIRQLMIDMGVPDERISVLGYGEEQAAKGAKNAEDMHQLSRRVDFKVF